MCTCSTLLMLVLHSYFFYIKAVYCTVYIHSIKYKLLFFNIVKGCRPCFYFSISCSLFGFGETVFEIAIVFAFDAYRHDLRILNEYWISHITIISLKLHLFYSLWVFFFLIFFLVISIFRSLEPYCVCNYKCLSEHYTWKHYQ